MNITKSYDIFQMALDDKLSYDQCAKCFQTFVLGNTAFAETCAGRSRTENENMIDFVDHILSEY